MSSSTSLPSQSNLSLSISLSSTNTSFVLQSQPNTIQSNNALILVKIEKIESLILNNQMQQQQIKILKNTIKYLMKTNNKLSNKINKLKIQHALFSKDVERDLINYEKLLKKDKTTRIPK